MATICDKCGGSLELRREESEDCWFCKSCGHNAKDVEPHYFLCDCGGDIIQSSLIIPGSSESTWICSKCQKTRDMDVMKAGRRKSLVHAKLPRTSSMEIDKQRQAGGRCCGLFRSSPHGSSYIQPDGK